MNMSLMGKGKRWFFFSHKKNYVVLFMLGQFFAQSLITKKTKPPKKRLRYPVPFLSESVSEFSQTKIKQDKLIATKGTILEDRRDPNATTSKTSQTETPWTKSPGKCCRRRVPKNPSPQKLTLPKRVFFRNFPKKQKWLISRGFKGGRSGLRGGLMLETSSKTLCNTSRASENKPQTNVTRNGLPRAD